MHLLFVPGLLCDGATFAAQTEALSGVAQCRVADHGGLDSLEAMAEALLETAPPSFALAGHSMGGRVALEVVRRAPGRVTHLALMDTGYAARDSGPAGDAEAAERMRLVAASRAHGMRLMGQEWATPMVHPSRVHDRPLMGAILDMIERKTPTIFAAQQRALIQRPDATAVLAAIACPTLVLCGQDDAWSPAARHREMAAAIAGSTLVEIPECGHFAPMEKPQAVTDALRAWLGS